MKKILIILTLILFPLIIRGQALVLDTVNVGTRANSRDGDPLRTAFLKINRTIKYVADTIQANSIDAETVFVKHVPDTIQKTANFTIDLDDIRKEYYCIKATSIVITIPAAATENIPIGTTINFYGEGAGIMVFKAAAGVHLHSDKDSIATSRQHQVVGLKKRGNNYWILYGPLTD